MDVVYAAGPALVCVLFAVLAINTDPEKRQVMRLLFLLSSLAALLVFMNVVQKAATYGEIVVDTQNVSYQYNGIGQMVNSSAVSNYTALPIVVASDYDMLWLIVSTVIWLVFIYLVVSLIGNGLEIAHRAVFKKPAGLDEIG